MIFIWFKSVACLLNPFLNTVRSVVSNRHMLAAVWLFFIGALSGTLAFAQAGNGDPRWDGYANSVFQHYTQDQGLPQPTVTALAEDHDGFLWIGTQGGLARWDGYRFRNYLPNLKVAGSIPDNFITALHADAAGQLWIGTGTAGLVRYDSLKDQFVKVDGLSSAEVTSMVDDGRGGLWIATAAGLHHLDTSSGKVKGWHHNSVDPDSLPDEQILTVMQDRYGAVWVGTKGALAKFDPTTEKFVVVPVTGRAGPASNFRSLHEDRKGRIWVGTFSDGAFVFKDAGSKPVAVQEGGTEKSPLSTAYVISIGESGNGDIWLGTYGDGIVVVNPDTAQTRQIRHDAKIFSSLLHDQIWTLYSDRTGSMLIGGTAGLDRLVNADSAFLSLLGDTNRAGGLTGNEIYSVFEAGNGSVWLGYSGFGVDVVSVTGARIASLRPDQNNPDKSLSKGPISAFASDDKSVFIGTDRGIYQADMNGKGLQRLKLKIDKKFDAVNINALLYDDGVLYFGGGREGLFAAAMNNAVKPVFTHLDEKQLTDQRVNVIIRGVNEELWVGTANGLTHIDLVSGAVEKIPFDPADPDGLSAGYVSSLRLDQQGRLWVGLFGGGVNLATGRNSKGRLIFKKVGTEEGLPNNNVDGLLTDSRGQIWVSTDDGIGVINPETFVAHAFHRSAGVAIATYWVNSAAKTATGELIFGGNGGMTVIRPDLVKDWNFMPSVVVTDAHIGGKPVPVYGTVTGQKPLIINPDANSIAVEFSSLDFTAPEQNRYSYRMEGFDRNWIETDYTRRLASYTNLPPGKYILQIRGTNRNGVWAEKSLSLPLKVLPAWYQTWLFRITMMLAIVLLIVLLVQVRTAYLSKAKLALEELVALRTQELYKSSEQLRQSKIQLEEIAFLDALTGLPNRRLFTERFENFKATSTRNNKNFALLLIDLDKFKYINDTYGHDAGDAVLVVTAERLIKATRAVDVVARLGGDEFAVLLDGSEPAMSIKVVCERIMAACQDPIVFANQQLIVSMSIGAAIYVEHGSFQAELYKSADMALYEAKGSGRNTWRCFGQPTT